MSEPNTAVGIYNTHTEGEPAIKELQRSGFDMKKLSIVSKDYHTEEYVRRPKTFWKRVARPQVDTYDAHPPTVETSPLPQPVVDRQYG